LTSVLAKLEESKQKLAVLKAQGDNKQATPILVPMLGKKTAEKVGDKQTELQDLVVSYIMM
jgi:E3 ubiquitin-protein ligase BRE1